jgi:hypothetical protein
MTHKPFEAPEDPVYVPLHVGRKSWLNSHGTEQSKLLTYLGDDSGDNISDQNCYYSELTGMYWVWKNIVCDYVGICHYRRYLLDHEGQLFTKDKIASVLADYDVITTKNLQLNYSYYEGFSRNHKQIYLDVTAQVIAELYPEYFSTYERLVHEKHTYFGNMLIVPKQTYDAYMEWLFAILFCVQERVTIQEEDSYHQRIFGFISEFLQYVWITHHQLSVYECMVGMLGEKAEVSETKRVLAEYFREKDFDGAKRYFLEAKRLRPDLLMEASDVTGELHLCMEVITIAGLEQQAYGTNLLERICEFRELMQFCNRLNRYALQKRRGQTDPELIEWVKQQSVTEVGLQVADAVIGAMGQNDKMYSII